jgi:hypothetical protein
LSDDEQARKKRLASVEAATKIARLIGKAGLRDGVDHAILKQSLPSREVALASEVGRKLAFQKEKFGSAALRDSIFGNFRHLEDLGGASYLRKFRAQNDALMNQITGSLSAGFLARQHELLDPFSKMNSSIVELSKSLRSPNFHEFVPQSASVAEQVARAAEPYNIVSRQAEEIAKQLAGITKPWSTFGYETASIAAALRLSQLASFNRELPAFSKDRAKLKAIEFGQFDKAMPVAEGLEDQNEAEILYTEAGRNPALVAFPVDAYDEVLAATGWALDIKPPDFIRPDGTLLTQAIIDPNDHYLISMIESHLKARIATTLIAAGGMSAVKRLFGNRLPDWERKRDDAQQKREPELHLIYYADFMEMAEIVSNKELWESTFKFVFRHKERFRIAIERLHALRIATSHSRPLTQTGKLRLLAEAIDLFEAMGVIPAKH